MVMRLTTAERVEADGLVSKIHVAANEPLGPKGAHREAMPQEADGTGLRTAADEDDRPDRMGLQVRSPGGGNGRRVGNASIRAAARWR
jgi:hypothetical protein